MLNWIIHIADTEGIPCWVVSSPAAHILYEKAGFEEVKSLDFDLRDYLPEDQADISGYGKYRLYYMLRKPTAGHAAEALCQ